MEPLAPGMRRLAAVLRRLPGATVATATDEQITRSSGARTPEPMDAILITVSPRRVIDPGRGTRAGFPELDDAPFR